MWPAGTHLLIRGLLLRNAVLPSGPLVVSGLAAPAPLAFNLSGSSSSKIYNSSSWSGSSSGSPGGGLSLDSCTVTASCANLAQFALWLAQLTPASLDMELTQVQLT